MSPVVYAVFDGDNDVSQSSSHLSKSLRGFDPLVDYYDK
jgi:hypothetical protein